MEVIGKFHDLGTFSSGCPLFRRLGMPVEHVCTLWSWEDPTPAGNVTRSPSW
jgi:hypothetical protein